MVKPIEGSGENGDGTEVHYVDFTVPTGTYHYRWYDNRYHQRQCRFNGHQQPVGLCGFGTSADGSAGKLMVSNASMNGVEINTGFTAGTADTTVSV